MSTRSMAARRRRAADQRKHRATPVPRTGRLIPGIAGPPPEPRSSQTEPARADDREAATAAARRQPLEHRAPPEVVQSQQASLPPLAARPSEPPAPHNGRRAQTGGMMVAAQHTPPDSPITQAAHDTSPQWPPAPPRAGRAPRRNREGFGWRERDWGRLLWMRQVRMIPAVGAGVLVLALLLGGTYLLATRTISPSSIHLSSPFKAAAPTANGRPVFVAPGSAQQSPTPALPTYTVGVWVADTSPPASGSDAIFVRVSRNVLPAAGVPVTIAVELPNGFQSSGRLVTNKDGYATYKLVFSNLPPDQPVIITATANTASGIVSASTTFLPQG
ncbi:MAG: hypothetical protein ACHQ4H_00240 [Ktedonobacterales bacterium]